MSPVECLPLSNFHTIPFPFFSTHRQGPSVACQKSCGGHRAEQCLSVGAGVTTPHENFDVESMSGQPALKMRFHNRVLEIRFFPKVTWSPSSFAVLLGSYVWSPFSCPSSNSSFLLLFLCHSWCIHASLATSHCGRNRFHLGIDCNSLLQASSQGCTDSATLGTGSALTDSEFSHSKVW